MFFLFWQFRLNLKSFEFQKVVIKRLAFGFKMGALYFLQIHC